MHGSLVEPAVAATSRRRRLRTFESPAAFSRTCLRLAAVLAVLGATGLLDRVWALCVVVLLLLFAVLARMVDLDGLVAEPERFDASFDEDDAAAAAPAMPAPARSEERADEGEERVKKDAPKGGFFGAMKRKLSELGGGGPNKRRVKATSRRIGNKLVVTFVALEDFAWAPPFGVTVNFDAGNTTATVDATLTTQAGHIARGLTVTLVLELADDGRAVRSIEFMSAGELLELELH